MAQLTELERLNLFLVYLAELKALVDQAQSNLDSELGKKDNSAAKKEAALAAYQAALQEAASGGDVAAQSALNEAIRVYRVAVNTGISAMPGTFQQGSILT